MVISFRQTLLDNRMSVGLGNKEYQDMTTLHGNKIKVIFNFLLALKAIPWQIGLKRSN